MDDVRKPLASIVLAHETQNLVPDDAIAKIERLGANFQHDGMGKEIWRHY